MSIQWALPLLADLLPSELHAHLQSVATDPYHRCPESGTTVPFYNGRDGEKIKDIPLVKYMRASRRKMRALCAEGIDVQYGKRLIDVSYPNSHSVAASFTDGTQFTGTLLVGADGARSDVRYVLLGEAGVAETVPYNALNLHVCYNDAEKALFVRKHLNPVMAMASHPDGYWLWASIQEVPDPEKPETWVFQLQTTWKRTAESDDEAVTDLGMHKRRAETFGSPFKEANLWIPEGTVLYQNKISYWHTVEIDTRLGRVALLGDAAHPMTFHRGQGLNHGIADAEKLVWEMTEYKKGNGSVAEALQAYQKDMVKRAGDEVKLSLRNTEMLHDWKQLRESPIFEIAANKVH